MILATRTIYILLVLNSGNIKSDRVKDLKIRLILYRRITFGLFFPDFPKAFRVSTINEDFFRISE